MKSKKLSTHLLVSIMFIVVFGVLQSTPFVGAEEILPSQSGGTCPSGVTNCGNYQLNDFMQLAINISKFILGIVGSLSLLAFVVGGFMFLISAGNQDRVASAKKIITGAIIGLVVVFTSYIIVGFVFSAMGIESGWQSSGWFSK